MQSFLPYPDFVKSAKVLDYRRLGQQRNEARLLYVAITTGNGWANHLVAKMWKGFDAAVAGYGFEICREWRRRGYKDNQLSFFEQVLDTYGPQDHSFPKPKWFGDNRFHSSHRSMLLMKNPEYYSQFGWTEEPGLGYFWPTKNGY